MTLNFSKIKSEADQSASENELSTLKEQQIIAAVAQHKIELRELFKSLFKGQNIETKNGGMQLTVPFGTQLSGFIASNNCLSLIEPQLKNTIVKTKPSLRGFFLPIWQWLNNIRDLN